MNTKKIVFNFFSIILLILITSIFISYANSFDFLLPNKSEAISYAELRGMFGATGDFFGGMLNPILSFITVLLLIYSIKIQLKELSATRGELALSRAAQEAQVKTIEKEFNMYSLNDCKSILDSQLKLIESIQSRPCLLLPAFYMPYENSLSDISEEEKKWHTADWIKSYLETVVPSHSFLSSLDNYPVKRMSIRDVYPVLKGAAYQFILKESDDGPEVESLKKMHHYIESAIKTYQCMIEFLNKLPDQERVNVSYTLQFYTDKIEYTCIRELKYMMISQTSLQEELKRITRLFEDSKESIGCN